MRRQTASIITGFIVLFFIYHLPEFFDAFWIMAVCKIGFLLAAFLLARLQGWNGLGGYGLPAKKLWLSDLCWGAVMGLTGFAVSVGCSVMAGYEAVLSFATIKTMVAQIPMLLLITAIPSIAEDILTRGYLFAHLGKKMHKPAWIFLSATVYVLNHIWRLNDGPAVLTYLFVFGLLLAFTVWQTKSLWLTFGIHWGANFAFEGSRALLKTKSLVTHDGPTWLLAVAWAALLVCCLLFLRERRSQTANK